MFDWYVCCDVFKIFGFVVGIVLFVVMCFVYVVVFDIGMLLFGGVVCFVDFMCCFVVIL